VDYRKTPATSFTSAQKLNSLHQNKLPGTAKAATEQAFLNIETYGGCIQNSMERPLEEKRR
jgi:hypothetical protein